MVDSARTVLGAALKEGLPSKWTVLPYADDIQATADVVVMLQQTEVTKLSAAPQGFRDTTFELHLLVPQQAASRQDDDLDVALEQLLDSIDDLESNTGFGGLRWIKATRKNLNNSPAYTVDLGYSTQRVREN